MHPPLSFSSLPHRRKAVGIDLGTTNSVIALLDPTDSHILTAHDDQGRCTFPSLVGYHAGQKRLVVGRAAQTLPADSAAAAVPLTLPLASVKRFMGLDRRFAVGPEDLSPPEVSAGILRHLRDQLAGTLADPRILLDAAVITMPAYFNHNQIEATRQAGQLAGFEVVELLHEPTAAAIYYSWVAGHEDATYLVYDLGGGTFDVSIIRRRLGDYEVLAVSGDPFLGGDDFDRLLASHLLQTGTWTASSEAEADQTVVGKEDLAHLFDPATPAGAVRFARLMQVAEVIKTGLTDSERVERFLPGLVRDETGRLLTLESGVEREAFQRLIKDKVDRTIEACHEALGRARERAGVGLRDIEHVILVGGSSRVPLVQETVRSAFCNPALADHARCLEPLLHEPDLCVAYGAALRAATHGVRYRFTSPDATLDVHLTSPVRTRDLRHAICGVVRLSAGEPSGTVRDANAWEGQSVRIRSLASGLSEEVFLDPQGAFSQEVDLRPETDNVFELVVCDTDGREMARTQTTVRHLAQARALGHAVLPTQIITKPLAIEVLSRGRQRVKQIVAPVGATLPGTFRCTCHTQDQAGRIVVPIYEENRVVHQTVVENLDATLPVGSPVEVEFAIDIRHAIEVKVRVQGGAGERLETARIEAAPPTGRPTATEVSAIEKQLDDLLAQFSGSLRSRARSRANRIRDDLLEALRYNDEPRAIQRMAELRDLVQQLEAGRSAVLDPPWPRFAQLVRHCLDLAAKMADETGHDREELFAHVHAQERYAEQAYQEQNQRLYRECCENLGKYAAYLDELLRDAHPATPPAPARPPEEAARDEVEQFRAFLSAVWKRVRAKGRKDLEARLTEIAGRARGLSQQVRTEPVAALQQTHRLAIEVEKVGAAVDAGGTLESSEGLLEGSG
jgi:molecular chaperone DnaK